jgi:hypothetical protein
MVAASPARPGPGGGSACTVRGVLARAGSVADAGEAAFVRTTATCEGLEPTSQWGRRVIPVGRSACAAEAGSKPVVWSRGSPRLATSLRVVRECRPALRRPDQNPSSGLTDGRAPGLRIIWWSPRLDDENDGSKTSGPTTCVGVAPRLSCLRPFERRRSGRGCTPMQESLRRRLRLIVLVVEGLHAKIGRKAGARPSARPDDGF